MRKSFTRFLGLLTLFVVLGFQMVSAAAVYYKTDPKSDQVNVKPGFDLTITFDYNLEDLSKTEAVGKVIQLKAGSVVIDAITLPSSRFQVSGNKVTIDIQATTIDRTDYTAVIPAGVVKFVKPDGTKPGNEAYSWSFTTGDYTAPKLSESLPFFPAKGTVNVGGSLGSPDFDVKKSTFKLTFNEPVVGVDGKYIKIYTSAGVLDEIIPTSGYSTPSTTVEFTTSKLRENTSYYILIDAGAFTDYNSDEDLNNKNEYAGLSDKAAWTFTTRDYTPATFATDYPAFGTVTKNSFVLKVKLNEPAKVYFLAKKKTDPAPTSISEFNSINSVDATVAGTEYSYTYNLSSEGSYIVYYYTVNKSKLLTNLDPLTSAIGKTGVKSTLDEVPPIVTDYTPSAGLLPVVPLYLDNSLADGHGTVSLTFTENVKAGAGNVILKNANDNSIVESVDIKSTSVLFKAASGSPDDATDMVVVKFSKKLDSSTRYYITIASGVILDNAGNKYAGISNSTTWYFVTKDVVAPTVAFSSTKSTTGLLGKSETVTITFSEPVQSSVAASAAVRVEKDNELQNTKFDISYKINSDSKIVGINIVPNGVAGRTDAWLENSKYVIRLLKNTISDISTNTITTEQVKSYSTDSYEAPFAYNDKDNKVWYSEPKSIKPTDNITFYFNEPVELLGGGAISTDNISSLLSLNLEGGASVPFTATYDATNGLVTIDPVADLSSSSVYVLNILDGYQDFKKIGGANSGAAYTKKYKTTDTVAPTLAFDFDKTNVSVSPNLVVKFSEPVNGVIGNQVTLRKGDANGSYIPVTLSGSTGSQTYTFTPSATLEKGTTYYLSFAAGVVEDLARNKNVGNSTSFVTLSNPYLVSSVPAHKAENVKEDLSAVTLTFSENVKSTSATGKAVQLLDESNSEIAYAFNSDLVFVGKTVSFNLTFPSGSSFTSGNKYHFFIDGTYISSVTNNDAETVGGNDYYFTIRDFKNPKLEALVAPAVDPDKLSDPLVLKFNEKVAKGIGTIVIQRVDILSQPQQVIDVNSANVSISVDEPQNVSISHSAFIPSTSTSSPTVYQVTVSKGAIVDKSGNKFAGLTYTSTESSAIAVGGSNSSTVINSGNQWYFSTALNQGPIWDKVASTPAVTLNSFDHSTVFTDNVSTSTNLVIAFTTPISIATNTATISIYEGNALSQQYKLNEPNVSVSGKTITVKLNTLVANKTYSVALDADAVKDAYGSTNTAITLGDWSFYTFNKNGPIPTVAVDGIYSKTTVPNWTSVKRSSNIVITFDDPIRKIDDSAISGSDIPGSIVTITTTTGGAIVPSYTANISSDKKTITINADSFDQPLTSSGYYKIVVQNVEDTSGNLVQTNQFEFQVGDYSGPLGKLAPNKGFDVVENYKGTEVKVKFNYDENATAYYKLLGEFETISVKDLVSSGTPVSVTEDADPATSVVIPTSEGTRYKLAVVAVDLVNSTPQDGVESMTVQTADVTVPTVVEYGNNGKLDVNPKSSIKLSLKFSDPVQRGSGNLYVFDSNNVLITSVEASSASITYSTDSKTVSYTLAAYTLGSATSYYVVVDKGFVKDLDSTKPFPNKDVTSANGEKDVNLYPGFSNNSTYTFTTKDADAPVVKNVTPRVNGGLGISSASNANPTSNIVLTFNENVKLGSKAGLGGDIQIIKPGVGLSELILANSSQVTISDKTVTIDPQVNFVENIGTYTVTINDKVFSDLSGNETASLTWNFDVNDVVAPVVGFYVGTDYTSTKKISDGNIDPTKNLIIKFIDPSTSKLESVRLIDNSGFIADDLDTLISLVDASGVKVPFTIGTYSPTVITVVPKTGALKSDSNYTLSFGSVFEDYSNNAISAQSISFKTKITDSPVIVFAPVNGSKELDKNVNFVITSSRSLVKADPTQTEPGYFQPLVSGDLVDYIHLGTSPTGNEVKFKATIDADKKVITIDPIADLESGTKYYLTFAPQGFTSTITNTYDNALNKKADIVDNSNIPVTVDALITNGTANQIEVTIVDYIAPYLVGDKLVPSKDYLDSDAKLQLVFNEPVVPGTGSIKIYNKDGSIAETIAASALTVNSDNDNIIEINPALARSNNSEYYVNIPEGAIVDKSSNKFAGFVDNTTWIYYTAQNEAPQYVSTLPVNGASNVSIYGNLTINFDKTIAFGSSGNIAIYKSNGDAFDLIRVSERGNRLAIDPVDNKKLIINFDRTFDPSSTYYVTLEKGVIVNKVGGAKFDGLNDITKWTFTTESLDAPKVVSLSPADDATGIVYTDKLVLKMNFDRNVALGSGTVRIVKTIIGTPVETIDIAAATVSGTEVTIPTTVALTESTDYHVFVDAGALTNTLPSKVGFAGIDAYTAWNFTTSKDVVAPTLTVSAPVAPIAKVFTVGLTFSEPVTGVASGITVTNGTFVVSGTGAQYSITVTSEEQKNVTIVLANTITDLAKTPNAFAGQTLSYTISAPVLVSSTPTGTLKDNHPTFVVTFADNVVVGAGSLNVYKKSDSTLALSIPVTVGMISGKVATVTYTYDAAKKNGLDQNTDYYVLVDKGFVKDVAGNEFAGVTASTTWTFKTGDFATITDPDVNNSLEFKVYPNPFVESVTVSNASELSKVVVSNIAGQVVKEVVYPDGTIQLNELHSGVYFIALYKDGKVVSTVKLLKR